MGGYMPHLDACIPRWAYTNVALLERESGCRARNSTRTSRPGGPQRRESGQLTQPITLFSTGVERLHGGRRSTAIVSPAAVPVKGIDAASFLYPPHAATVKGTTTPVTALSRFWALSKSLFLLLLGPRVTVSWRGWGGEKTTLWGKERLLALAVQEANIVLVRPLRGGVLEEPTLGGKREGHRGMFIV